MCQIQDAPPAVRTVAMQGRVISMVALPDSDTTWTQTNAKVVKKNTSKQQRTRFSNRVFSGDPALKPCPQTEVPVRKPSPEAEIFILKLSPQTEIFTLKPCHQTERRVRQPFPKTCSLSYT